MGRDAPVGNQILELFTAKEGQAPKRFTLNQLYDCLPHLPDTSVKSAMKRLRGEDGGKRMLRVVGYKTQVGHGGRTIPIFELGVEPDVPRTDEYVEDMSVENSRRARNIRHALEDRKRLKSLALLDDFG